MSDEVLTEKAQILDRMADSRRTLQAVLDRAGPALLDRPGTWGDWSLKDLLAHIIYWQTVAIDRFQKVADGRVGEIRLMSGDDEINQVNDNVYRANKDRPLPEILDLFHTTYLTLRTAVKSLPAPAFREEPIPGTFSVAHTAFGDGYGHDEEHRADVEKAIDQGANSKP